MLEHPEDKEIETLKDLMERAGLTEPQLSQRVGVSLRIINHWKMKRKVPRLDNALSLAKELNVPIKVLAKSLGLDISDIPDDMD